MHNPTHPGDIIKRMITTCSFTSKEIIDTLKIDKETLIKIIHKKIGINDDIAQKLSILFATNKKMWIDMQKIYDEWEISKNGR